MKFPFACSSFREIWLLIRVLFSLEAAANNPENLTQANIIENLDPAEAARLSRVRNIGIAVTMRLFKHQRGLDLYH